MHNICLISQVLAIIGSLNWGLIGVFNFNLVTAIFGDNIVAKSIYILVGLAGLRLAYLLIKNNYLV
ncbi:MAG: DUF378 domain-containing protein [Rickettsiales bacterium]|nr:MAG: DUF378 domain-containing protein [Rickettsiales bacterium]